MFLDKKDKGFLGRNLLSVKWSTGSVINIDF